MPRTLSVAVIKKAVFPVAGLGTRFLPATKASPKEMFPIADKPLVQHVVEEAVAAGLTELIFITGHNKQAVIDHFDRARELEHVLVQRREEEKLSKVQDILPSEVSCIFLRQPEPLGLGHAVLCARPVVGDEPFAVLLSDDLIRCQGDGVLQQLLDCWQQQGGQRSKSSVIAVTQVPAEEVGHYGVADIAKEQSGQQQGALRLRGIVEKPKPGQAPSRLAVVGRYILDAGIFPHLSRLGAALQPGRGEELQLTDAIAGLLQEAPVYACLFQGQRYDCGSHAGYLQATLDYAMDNPLLAQQLRQRFLSEHD